MAQYTVIGVILERESQGVTDVVVLPVVGKARSYTLSDVVELINNGNQLFTETNGRKTPVFVVSGVKRGTYIRTAPNNSVEDNLLRQRRYN